MEQKIITWGVLLLEGGKSLYRLRLIVGREALGEHGVCACAMRRWREREAMIAHECEKWSVYVGGRAWRRGAWCFYMCLEINLIAMLVDMVDLGVLGLHSSS